MQYSVPKRLNKGFSLTEILITLIVVGVGIAVVVRFQGISAREGQIAKQRAQAATLLEQKMEELRADPVAAAAAKNGEGTDVVRLESMQFDRKWQVTENPQAKGEYLINASAEWADLGYSARQNSLKQFADNDPAADIIDTGKNGPHASQTAINHANSNSAVATRTSTSTDGGFVTPNTRLTAQSVVRVSTRQMGKGISLPCVGNVSQKSQRMKRGESEEDRQWEDSMGMHEGKRDAQSTGCSTTTVRRHGMMRMHE